MLHIEHMYIPVTQDQSVSSARNEVRFRDLSTLPPLTLYCPKSSQCQEMDGCLSVEVMTR